MSIQDPNRFAIGTPSDLRSIAEWAATLVFRTDLSQPGFALLDLGVEYTPRHFRGYLIALVAAFDEVYRERFKRKLVYLSLGRFDQQATTRAHRDGSPDESILVLGYEPTPIISRLSLLDCVRCARDRGMTPREFLDRDNPAFGDNESLLRDYETEVAGFQSERYQILVINNSCAPLEGGRCGMLGVLHKAVVFHPQTGQNRYVNSLTLTTAEREEQAGRSDEEVRAFIESAADAR
jgi:hypothetical protein